MKDYIKNHQNVKNIREAKKLVTSRIQELQDIILNGNRREKDNAKRALAGYELILAMLGKFPDDISSESIKNVNFYNAGDVFEVTRKYERTSEIGKSGKGKTDLLIGTYPYELKALTGRNAITVSPLKSGGAEILLKDGRVYRLKKECYNKMIQEFAKTKNDKYNGERLRLSPNKEIESYIKSVGKIVKDYFEEK